MGKHARAPPAGLPFQHRSKQKQPGLLAREDWLSEQDR